MSSEYWNEIYSAKDIKYALYDGWLNRYQSIWKEAINIIDLGCGCGVDTIYLNKQNITTIACDFSKTALGMVISALLQAHTMCFDMTEGLPFRDDFSDLVIADLSLHYFTKDKTMFILDEIKRILKGRGHLLCRVNSVKEFEQNENLLDNTEIERHLYENKGHIKRFFDSFDIDEYFNDWDIEYLDEVETTKYGHIKYAWEICVRKRDI